MDRRLESSPLVKLGLHHVRHLPGKLLKILNLLLQRAQLLQHALQPYSAVFHFSGEVLRLRIPAFLQGGQLLCPTLLLGLCRSDADAQLTALGVSVDEFSQQSSSNVGHLIVC
ncbi:hypothetical protein BV898_05151 [Hypsibius exemplaris]|uniref:Uncharacterized protein n=1 Tax=Hypsibius exemplaris TaxID=2072580 RepID=A0A1W0X051_HYPEX|nr:hypothetical protein BV898_05151 [Hypsibius exemplaris]